MPINLSYGSQHPQVITMQRLLGIEQSGVFDDATFEYVIRWQRANRIYSNGVFGFSSWRKATHELDLHTEYSAYKTTFFDVVGRSKTKGVASEQTSEKFRALRDYVREHKGIFPGDDGRRFLHEVSTSCIDGTSLLYVGRCVQLDRASGMVDPFTDPYVVVLQKPNLWVVYARAEDGEEMELDAYTNDYASVPVTGKFVNVTEKALELGLRQSRFMHHFLLGEPNASLWWMFEDHEGLTPGLTWSEILQEFHPRSELLDKEVWAFRHLIYGADF